MVNLGAVAEPETPPLLITTTETIAGYKIVRTLGFVWGTVGSLGLSPEAERILPGKSLSARARAIGANAVIAARWAGPPSSWLYGTAVVVQPEVDQGDG